MDPGMGEGNRKMSLVDLTGRSAFCLDSFDNGDGYDDDDNSTAVVGRGGQKLIGDGDRVSLVGGPETGEKPSSAREVEALKEVDELSCGEGMQAELKFANGKKKEMLSILAERRKPVDTTENVDRETEKLFGKMGHRETCVVNAAILANGWGGRKRFNKPIVVDIDLPVWGEGVGDTQ